MPQQYKINLEARVLKNISSDENFRNFLFAKSVDASYFGYHPSIEIFNRSLQYLKSGQNYPTVDLLLSDPVLTKEAVTLLQNRNITDVLPTEYDQIYMQLKEYKYYRSYCDMLEKATDIAVKTPEKIDLGLLTLQKGITSLQTNTDKPITTLGAGDNSGDCWTEMLKNKPRSFFKTGFKNFDDPAGGFLPGEVLLAASVTGGGKSVLAIQFQINMFMQGIPTLLVNFEMVEQQIMERIASNITRINHDKFRKRILNYAEATKVARTRTFLEKHGQVKNVGLSIWNPAKEMTIAEIGNIAKMYNYKVILIDYISLLQQEKSTQWESLGEAARQAKLVATNNKCLVIVFAQLDEDTLQVKYAKAMRHHSDFVWTWNYGKKEEETKLVKIKQIKGRSTKRDLTINLQAEFEYSSFKNWDGPLPEAQDKKETTQQKLPSMPGIYQPKE